MLLPIICILLLTFHDAYSSVKHAECRIVYDKFHRMEMASRNFIQGEKWPNNEVPFVISPTYSRFDVTVLRAAMEEIQNKSCITWVPRTNQRNYVNINHKSDGCFAVLGYNRHRGVHNLNLQRDNGFSTCMIKGIATHEMLHILGFAHEQTRPDRDEYVKIIWENIKRESASNYFRSIDISETERPPQCDIRSTNITFDDCYSGYKTRTFGLDYDYGSLMHYGLTYFSTNGSDTMTVLKPLPSGVVIGNRDGMTELDSMKLQARYDCNGEPETTTTQRPLVECRDRFTNCQRLKYLCSRNVQVRNGCQVTCEECEECYDRYSNCPQLGYLCGEDDHITEACKLTCRTC